MAQKHLHELLKEDQEPFHLKNYIAERRCQLKTPGPKSTLQVKKHKPIVESSITKRSLYKQACFFSFQDSPDVRKSPPCLSFPSPASKSPCRSPSGTVFLHIPTRTAALLLEAAIKIQKQSKTKTQIKNPQFGLFGSFLKRPKDRNQTKKREIANTEFRVSVNEREKFSRKREKVRENVVVLHDGTGFEMGLSCSCNNSRLSSAGWSETNEDKSLDLDTCSSCRSEISDENGGFSSCEKHFCSSPFRFSLQRNPSSGVRTPEFSTPATSPSRHQKELAKITRGREEEEEEEEKEQCSPVSVLDPPFDNEDDRHEGGVEEDNEYDLKCSYEIVQRAKQQLLQKLRRFEKLAELDPIELEKRMLEEQDDDDEDLEEEEECEDGESPSLCREDNVDEFVREACSRSNAHHQMKTPTAMKRLVADLIDEERSQLNGLDNNEVLATRVSQKLNAWKEVDSNTIDMMVDLDFRRELDGWKRFQEQVGETAVEIEIAIFGLLVEELSEELVCLGGL
ncbi:unnamed protein product [Ilex paraguariensis]|uniref:DUF4378 domain-containing protein n=1 Tax=Ilex paraguariensis TaxID=185542 RepID=A0ABC8RV02_9AQUA